MQTEVHEMQTKRQHSQRERGSIIIFAVGVLVLLAVLAAVFLTSSQQQRETGTSTVLQHMNSRSGSGVPRVMDHIVDIISRDVFDPMTPETMRNGTPLVASAPSAFETWDYPYTRVRPLLGGGFEPTVGRADLFNKGGDDPWLADIDPQTHPGSGLLGLLENAGSYDPTFGYWMNLSKIHPLGVFVKIGYDLTNGADTGDPSDFFFLTAATNPELFVPDEPDGKDPIAGTGIFATPPSDLLDREWADTDGDGHYDARWTTWDGLFNRAGYSFYVAARVIDLSGMVNVNTATSFQRISDPNPDQAPMTPADVDLLRFLSTPDYTPIDGGGSLFADGEGAFERALVSLGYARLPNPAPYQIGTFFLGNDSGQNYARLAVYDQFMGRSNGIFEFSGQHQAVAPFQIDDEIELRAYASRNDPASESRLEAAALRTLHASTDDELITRDDIDASNITLRVQQYMVDLRHRLTTMSKARRLGPQTGRFPTVHNLATGKTQYPAYPIVDTKTPLPAEYDAKNMIPGDLFADYVAKYFKAYATALAPYAVMNTSDGAGLATWGRIGNDDYLAYGWDMLVRDGSQDNVMESTEQFAIRTAAHLALNTADLFDGPLYFGLTEPFINTPPRFVRLSYSLFDQNQYSVDQASHPVLTLDDLGMVAEPPLGDIEGEREVWLFGQKPHPFLVEAAAFVLYQDDEGITPPDDESDSPTGFPTMFIIDFDGDGDEDPYRALYVEIRNPYEHMELEVSREVWLDQPYELRIGGDPIPLKGENDAGKKDIVLGRLGSGDRSDIIVLEILNDKLKGKPSLRDQYRDALGLIEAGVVYEHLYTVDTPGGLDLWDTRHNQVELWRRIATDMDPTAHVKAIPVDVMATTSDSEFPLDPGDYRQYYVNGDEWVIGIESYIQRNAKEHTDNGCPAFVLEVTSGDEKHGRNEVDQDVDDSST